MRLPVVASVLLTASIAGQAGLSNIERQRAQQMLASIKDEIRRNYYDPAFGGRNLDQHFAAAHTKLSEATSLGTAMGIIAQALLEFDDSHTFFIPPPRTTRVEYGWSMRMVGDECYVGLVRPGSDAERQGVKPGDHVLALEGRRPTRGILWKMEYQFYTLSPRPALRVTLQSPGQPPRDVQLAGKVTQRLQTVDLTGFGSGIGLEQWLLDSERDTYLDRPRTVRIAKTVVWKLPTFMVDPDGVDSLAGEALAGVESLILDLRGNGGGYVKTLERLVGRLFDRDVRIADLKGRKAWKPSTAKKHSRPFGGKVVVLIDSRSASASELFARVMQLEKRGIVLGDRSAGAVMQSYGYQGQMGSDRLIFFGASVTNADVIMADGKSLEKTGVIPDEIILPTADDIAAQRDPVLARAAAVVGATLDPKQAGALFPTEWR
jgi:C-terminal processing protease CtpA/Prc